MTSPLLNSVQRTIASLQHSTNAAGLTVGECWQDAEKLKTLISENHKDAKKVRAIAKCLHDCTTELNRIHTMLYDVQRSIAYTSIIK